MLKKSFICLCALVCTLPLLAQVSFLSVTDEDKHTQKEDFWHTFEYYIIAPDGQAGKCQATRIAKNWFATAAHCVADRCQNGCTLRMDMLEQPISFFISAQHTPKNRAVFIHPLYDPKKNIVLHDFALLKMKVAELPARFYIRPKGKETKNVEISKTVFRNFIKKNASARWEFNSVLHPHLPPLLIFPNATKRINRKLSVISIFDGKRNILKNPYPTDYVKELGFAYTQNFGVIQGMSGSGVMTNTGELAGIISAYLTSQIVGDKSSREDYFMFPVFNADLTDFMEEVMGSDYDKIERKEASADYVVRSPKDHSNMLHTVRGLQKKK